MQKPPISSHLLITLLAAILSSGAAAVAFQETPQTAPSAAADGAESPPEPNVHAAAAQLLTEARDRLFQHASVRANLVESASLGGRRFRAEGTYLAGAFPRLRLEYRVQVGDVTGTLLQVCDGQILRTRREVATATSDAADDDSKPATAPEVFVTRRDVQQILRAAESAPRHPETLLAAELGLGGLPSLLAGMEKTMTFDALRRSEAGGREFQVIQGRWKADTLKSLRSQLGNNAETAGSLIPDVVRIYLDGETLFPSRILYLQQSEVEGGPTTYHAVLSLEFTDVVLNEAVDPEEFRYVPPAGVNEVDETKEFVRAIQAAQGISPADGTANEAGSD